MKTNDILRYGLGASLVAGFFACSTSTSTPSTSSSPPTPDTGAEDAGADAFAEIDGRAAAPDCALADSDRDDAGFPQPTVDRTRVGEICWVPDGGTILNCKTDEVCAWYRLPEDPPSTYRCGPSCKDVTCPGAYHCTMGLSHPTTVGCDCP